MGQRLLEIQSDYAISYRLYVLNHDLVHSDEESETQICLYADIKKDYQVAKAQILGFLQE
jgi:hypothetical protein